MEWLLAVVMFGSGATTTPTPSMIATRLATEQECREVGEWYKATSNRSTRYSCIPVRVLWPLGYFPNQSTDQGNLIKP